MPNSGEVGGEGDMERIKRGDTVQLISGADVSAARRDGKKVQGTVQRVIRGYKIDRFRRRTGIQPGSAERGRCHQSTAGVLGEGCR